MEIIILNQIIVISGNTTNQNSFNGFTESFELVGGIKNFTVNEVEVFMFILNH